VVAGELAPFKHKSSPKDTNAVTPPLVFMRSLFCLSKGAQPHRTCNATVHFDVWSHHPYTTGPPTAKATTAGGVELGDLPKMWALLQSAENLNAIVSAQPVQFWVTEVGWASRPPRPKAAPMALLARWTSESMYQMWKSGVSLATWYLLQDPPSPDPFQSGLYFYSTPLASAHAKPILTPFRFPFVAYFKTGGTVQVWGRDATSDQQDVEIQRQVGGKGPWSTVANIESNANGIFSATLPAGTAKRKDWLRASAPGSGTSLAFALKPPANEKALFPPWG
jgi:hypothetical protein